MSLIQEALKRQQEDADKSVVGAPAPAAADGVPSQTGTGEASPPPLPQRAAAPTGSRGSGASSQGEKRAWPALIGVFLLLAVLVGGAVWMLYFAYLHFTGDGQADPDLVEIATAGPGDTSLEPPEPPTRPPPEPVDKPDTRTNDVSAVEAVAATNPSGSSAEDLPTPSRTTPTPPEAPETQDDHPTRSPGPPSEPVLEPNVEWPELSIGGTVGKGDSGAAWINNQVISVGERIKGVTVTAVGPKGVTLEYKGHTRTIRAGGTTE